MTTETIKISHCCKRPVIEDYKSDDSDELEYTCKECYNLCEAKEVCAECLGTGEVTVDEQVYPGEPHTAPIGTRKCICKLPDPDDYPEE